MTWRRRSGIVTAPEGRQSAVLAHLKAAGVLALVESRDTDLDTVHLVLAVDMDGRVATWADGHVQAGPELAEFAATLATEIGGEVTFGEETWTAAEVDTRRTDPFEHHLGADIATYADRAVVLTRANEATLSDIAGQIDDTIHALPHAGGHALLITEGPILTTLTWTEDARPVLIIEHGAAAPAVTVIGEGEAHLHSWTTTAELTFAGDVGAQAFADATLGLGALVREIMTALPAVEPGRVRTALGEGVEPVLAALELPPALLGYLNSVTEAADVPGVVEIHPASFVRSIRAAVSDASSSVTERAEAIRHRALAVRTRAETAFDAAEAFAEDVVMPVRQNWLSPALAVAETALGVLALRKARRLGGGGGAAVALVGALLLTDALVNTAISLAPLLRRRA